MAQHGVHALHRQLAKVDPLAAARIHRNDPQRTLRALEVWEITGKPLSRLQAEAGTVMPYRAIKLVRSPEQRSTLHERINQRFDAMLAAGFVDEVRGLVARGDLHPEMPSMRSVGYRQVWAWLRGECDYDEMTERGRAATRQLAKRQMTWLRSETDCHWLNATGDPPREALHIIEVALATVLPQR